MVPEAKHGEETTAEAPAKLCSGATAESLAPVRAASWDLERIN